MNRVVSVTILQLTIVASDRGASPRMTSRELTVRVIDKNDNPPQFEEVGNANICDKFKC